MSFSNEILTAVNAAQVGVRINTDEIEDSLAIVSQVAKKRAWNVITWDAVFGRKRTYTAGSTLTKKEIDAAKKKAKDGAASTSAPERDEDGLDAEARQLRDQLLKPVGIMKCLIDFLAEPPSKIQAIEGIDMADVGEAIPTILVIKNAHIAFEQQRMHISTVMQEIITAGKDNGKFLFLMMPAEAKLPPEVAPLFHVINHELPTTDELVKLLKDIHVTDGRGENETPEILEEAAKAAAGLTRLQAEGIFASSLVSKKRIDPQYIWDKKAEILNEEALVELSDTKFTFDNIGGMTGIKDFLRKLCEHSPLEDVDSDVRAKGVAAVGPPGVGKSLLAYCLGNELGIKAVKANPGNLMDKYVGDTEKNVRRFFQLIKQLSPCIVIMDEAGQVMPNGKDGSSEVAKRMLGSFLTQMNDMKEKVFWFFTANDLTTLHEAFLRAERIDAKIYVRLPAVDQRADIWKMYLEQFSPEKINGKINPQHISLDIPKVLAAYSKAKARKQHDVKDTGEKLAAALLAIKDKDRKGFRDMIKDEDVDLYAVVLANTFDDEGWTPAEIKSCCRISHRLKESIFETAQKTAHVCIGKNGQEILERLDNWAENEGALDAETGKCFRSASNATRAVSMNSEFDPNLGARKNRVIRRNSDN